MIDDGETSDTTADESHISINSSEDSVEEYIEEAPCHVKTNINLIPLTVLVFYNVAGGPFGIEPTVRASGALLSIVGFTIFPLIWSVPEALVTAELGSAFPCSSGGVAWVDEAFGSTAGGLIGYLSYASGVTDNAIYPVLFLEYILELYDKADTGFLYDVHSFIRYVSIIVLASIFTLINLFGLKFVGNVSLVVAIISMSPFIIMFLLGLPQVDPKRWFVLPDPNYIADDDESTAMGWIPITFDGVNWRMYLNNLFWNLNSFDSGASFASDVSDISTFYNAMIGSIYMTFFCYFLPLIVALGAVPSKQIDWVDGYLANLASTIVGPWLGHWTVISSGISNLALFHAEMSTDAWQIAGMAKRGFAPKIFQTRSRFGTPIYGIILGFIVIVIMSSFNFTTLVEMMNFNYSIALLMEYAAFIKLRISRPDVIRPYRVPFGTIGCILMVTPACLSILLMLFLADYKTYLCFILFSTIALLFLYLKSTNRGYESVYFTSVHHDRLLLSKSLNHPCEMNGKAELKFVTP